jgi:dipeptidyl aminopeptidase/acylaminoacyl peptidase
MKTSPYGSWVSPITSGLITGKSIGLSGVFLNGDAIYWLESRPLEGGRTVLVESKDGTTRDITPPGFNIRTLTHEYGGGACVISGDEVFFANFFDQRIYRQKLDGEPVALTGDLSCFFADLIVDRPRNRLICVCEDHSLPDQEALTTLNSVSLETGETEILAAGNDFYSNPRLSADGKRLAWLSWNHPNMPWDGTTLWQSLVGNDGYLSNIQRVVGGASESIFQPEWSPAGILHYVSDRSGFWNIYRHEDYLDGENLCEKDYEFGMPQWVFGMTTYGFKSADEIVCAFSKQGSWQLALLDATKKELRPIETGFTEISYLKVSGNRVVFRGGSPTEFNCIVEVDLNTGNLNRLKSSASAEVETAYFSKPESIVFPTVGERNAYAFFYAPKNKDFNGPPNERPPLIVTSHGGPTGAASSTLELEVQFWTSRGFALCDVNYGGSTGFGRQYRERLNGNWGIVDADDCVEAARYLVSKGLVDGKRCAISGGSAGGYTTLCALAFCEFFQAGASHYGIGDLAALEGATHKFESRYTHRLIGPYPEAADLYAERSPLLHAEKIKCPVIFLQGLEDKVVPPSQSEDMVKALRQNGIPVAYLPFEGEQHGFRKAENIKRAIDAELYFYAQIFSIKIADAIEPIKIENFSAVS